MWSNIWPVSPSPFPFSLFQYFFFSCSVAPTLSVFSIERNKSVTGVHYHGTALQFKWTLTPCDIHEMSMWVPEQTSCQRSRQTKFYFLWLGTTGQPMSPSLSYPITFGSTLGNWLQHWLFSIPVGCMNNWPIWCPEFNSSWKHHSTVISRERPVFEHADSKSEAYLRSIQTKPGTLILFSISPYFFLSH